MNVDLDTWKQITALAKATGKSKAEIVRIVFQNLTESCSYNKALMKVIQNPMKNAVIFQFFALGKTKVYKV